MGCPCYTLAVLLAIGCGCRPTVSLLHGERAASLGTQGSAKPKLQNKTVFVAILTKRSSHTLRDSTRALWSRVAAEGDVVAKYVLCNRAGKEVGGEDGLGGDISREATAFGDMLLLDCEEGYSRGRLSRKVLAALRAYRDQYGHLDLFMKVDDDTFVAWSNIRPRLKEIRRWKTMYLGVTTGNGNVTRNESSKWFEPNETFVGDHYPRTMAGGTGYFLGGDLVRDILARLDAALPHEAPIPWNEDRAVAVWVNESVAHGMKVNYLNFQGFPYALSCNGTWRTYPFWSHGSLTGQAIACLAAAERANSSTDSIGHCFSPACGGGVPGFRRLEDYYNISSSLLEASGFASTGCWILDDASLTGYLPAHRC